MNFQAIQYLRWARNRHFSPSDDLSLILSGMLPPDVGQLGDIDSTELIAFHSADRVPLTEQIAEAYDLDPSRVWIQPGTHWTLFALLAARLQAKPGPVIVEEPAYEPLRRIPEALGAELLRLPRGADRAFQPELDVLSEFEMKKPSAIILSQPHNPSGAVMPHTVQEQIVAWAAANDCAVISDEVYLEFLADPDESSFLARSPEVVAVRSFTKVMGLPGLRTTIACGPPDWLAQAAAIGDYGPLAISGPAHALASRAFERRTALWTRARETASAGRTILSNWLSEQQGRVEAFLPDAGIISFPRLVPELHAAANRYARAAGVEGPFGYGLDAHPDGSHLWLAALAREERVHLTPGAFFEDARGFRVGFGISPESLREALSRWGAFLTRVTEAG